MTCQVLDRVNDLNSPEPDFVGRADDMAGFDAASGEEHRLSLGVVIASDCDATPAVVIVGAAAKLSQPNDERFI